MSRYSKLLTKIIAESGLTSKEVVDKCNEMGNGIDVTRLSKIQNGKLPAPSEKVSRDLAKVCNSDGRLLVLEGYLEKAPKEIVDAFVSIQLLSIHAGLHIFKNNVNEKTINEIEEQLLKEPLSNFIVSMIDAKDNTKTKLELDNTTIIKEDNSNLSLSLNEPIALEVIDNAMYPIVAEKSKINLILQDNYKNGDLIAFKMKKDNSEGVLVRYVLFDNDKVILNALNNKYEQLILKKADIIILGKVYQVITKL